MKTTPLPPFDSEGFEKHDQAFPRFACAGESMKVPGVRLTVSPRSLTRNEQSEDITIPDFDAPLSISETRWYANIDPDAR